MTATLPRNQNRRDLMAIVGLAFSWRVLFLLAVPRVLDTADAIHYVEAAARLASGDFMGLDPKIPLLYPLISALYSYLISDMEWACRMVSFSASFLTVVPVYLLARDLHGIPTARISGVAVALWPWLADYGCSVSTEALAVLLWLTAVLLFSRGMRHGGTALYGSAAAFCALSLTRPEGLFILLCTAPAALVLTWKPSRPDVGRYAKFALPCVLLVLLNALYVRMLTGTTTANYRVGFIIEEFDFARFGQTAVQSFSDVLPVMLGPVLFLFLGVGFFHPRSRKRDARLELCLLLFAAAQWGLSLFVLSPAPRYLMATLIVLLLWSACGIELVSREIATARPKAPGLRRLPFAALVFFFLAHTAVTLGSEHLGRRPREPREYKEAGRWMEEHLSPGLIFTRKPQVGYYAKMPSTGPALEETLEESLQRARAAKAAYVVVDERYTTSMVPALRSLLDPANAPTELVHEKTFDTWPDSRVVIYSLRPDTGATP